MAAMNASLPPSPMTPVTPAAHWPLAFLAVAAPTLLAANDPPSVTFYNQVLSVFGWGLWMAALLRLQGGLPVRVPEGSKAWWALTLVLVICGAGAWWSSAVNHLPVGLALMASGMAAAAWVAMSTAWRSSHRLGAVDTLDVMAEALALTGAAGLALGFLQVFVPSWTDGLIIAETSTAGRAVGNLRQPNHLSTLLIWATCGAVWLGRRRQWALPLAALAVVMFMGGVVWTASRTGMLGTLLLTLWAVRDRHMPTRLRWVVGAAPLIYAAWWLGMDWWAHVGKDHAFAAGARLNDGSDISSSRFKIWSDTLTLIQAQPWTGVGWGQFNLAWTFTELPNRPVAFFDHTHNVILQWAVELGVPMALALTAFTTWAVGVLWFPWRRLGEQPGDAEGPEGLRLGVVAVTATMVTMAGLHSLLEYPLWYSYFLLPLAFVWGVGLAARAGAALFRPEACTRAMEASTQPHASWTHAVPALVVAVGALWCAIDYQWAANVYAPRPGAGPLDDRITSGQQRLWFGYQADYAKVTGPDDDEPSEPPAAFTRTLHNLVDSRLMIAYARSLAEHGELDKARYIVARLREFNSRQGREFLAQCDKPLAQGAEKPFQCEPAKRRYTWREVLPY